MHALAEHAELIGFFSYSREDDADSNGALSALRGRIQRELRTQLGRTSRDFRLWQDKEAIAPGTLWESEINAAIAQSVFFIPIITPSTTRSEYCRIEFEAFLEREQAIGRSDLIFPILYVRVPALEDAARRAAEPLLSMIAQRQYVDWREFRHQDVFSPQVGELIERFCGKIVEALARPYETPAEREQRLQAEAEEQRLRFEAARQQQDERRRVQEAARQQRRLEQVAASAVRESPKDERGRKPGWREISLGRRRLAVVVVSLVGLGLLIGLGAELQPQYGRHVATPLSPPSGSADTAPALPHVDRRDTAPPLPTVDPQTQIGLGLTAASITPELRDKFRLMADQKGVLITAVAPMTPAAERGLKPGDVILEVQQSEVAAPSDISKQLDAASKKGHKFALLLVQQEGVVKYVPVPLEKAVLATVGATSPDATATISVEIPGLGLKVAPVSLELKDRFQLAADQKGVVITDVAPNTSATERDLKPGDVIMEVQQAEVGAPVDVQKQVDAALAAGRKSVLMLIHREEGMQYVPLSLTKASVQTR